MPDWPMCSYALTVLGRWLKGFLLHRHRQPTTWVTVVIPGAGVFRAWKPRRGATVIHLLGGGRTITKARG